jgi:hypothetical protein
VIWDDLALPDLMCSFKLAIGPTKMLLSFCAVLAVCALGYVMDRGTRSVSAIRPSESFTVLQTELDVYIAGTPKETRAFIEKAETEKITGVFGSLWTFFSGRFHDASTQLLNLSDSNMYANVKFAGINIWLCMRAVGWAFYFHPCYSLVYFSVVFGIMVFAGAAITRCAALEFSKAEKPGLFEVLGYAADNYRSFLSAPLLPLGLVGVFGFGVILLGMIASIPRIGELLMALLFGLVLVIGFLITLMALGALAGSLLLFPSVAYEKSSGLDSIGRAFNYVLGAPAWMCYYVFASAVIGTFFYLVLRLLVFLSLILTHRLLWLGAAIVHAQAKLQRIWPEPNLLSFLNPASESSTVTESVAFFVIRLFMLGVVGILLSYIISYFFSSAAVIYSLMRKKVDKIELNQIYIHLEQVINNQ